MFQKQCEKIVLSGISNGHIDKDKKEVFLYGINMLFDVSVNILSMLLIGIVMGRLWECVVFCAVYKVLRKYTGGFHFDSAWKCYLSSCIMYFAFIWIQAAIPFRLYEASVIVVISAVILWCLSPVEAVNKPLEYCEKVVYKKRARINIAIIMFAFFTSIIISNQITYVIGIGIIAVTIFAILGQINLYYLKYIEV